MTETSLTWKTNNGTTIPLTPFWIMLNFLNKKTNSYPNTYLNPSLRLYSENNLIRLSKKLLLDSVIQKIKTPETEYLLQFLNELHELSKKYQIDFLDSYWYEDVSDLDRSKIYEEKRLIFTKAHTQAPIN